MAIAGEKITLAAGALAAIGASLCCVGPLVLLTLGIGGAWIGNLTALAPYRPIFIGLSLLFLFLSYRRMARSCAMGGLCADPRGARRRRLFFWTVTALLFGLLALPYAALAAATKTVILDVGNMTCPLCRVTVRKALENVPGVAHVDVDYAAKTATVTFDPEKADADAFERAAMEAGFPSIARNQP